MKEFLEKLIEQKQTEKENLVARSEQSESIEEVRAIGTDITKVEEEIRNAKEQLSKLSETEEREFKPMGTYEIKGTEMLGDNIEQRLAFANFVVSKGAKEVRADAFTYTSDVPSVIPQNLINSIIEKYEQVGTLYNRVTRTFYPVGQTIPVDGIKPVATWVNEGASSDSQNKTTSSIVFAHYKVRCEVAWSQEVDVMSLPAFEALFVKQVGEAIIKAVESKIIDGTGTSQIKGLLSSEAPEGQEITLPAKITYKELCEMEGAIPGHKEAGTVWVMSKKTFMSFYGITDSAGQPVARTNYGIAGTPERSLLGREVVIFEPQANSTLKSYPSAETGAVVAFAFDLSDYVLNNNYDLGIERTRDWDTEDIKMKAVAAFDGKPINLESLVIIKKA